jgi:hypothetical protein
VTSASNERTAERLTWGPDDLDIIAGEARSFGASVAVELAARREDPWHPATLVEPDEPDEPTWALIVALDELVAEYALRAWDPAKHPRNPKGTPGGGKFRSMVDRLKDAITEHMNGGGGEGHPFKEFDREQLRKAAKARGITLTRGEDRDSIAQKLLDDLRGGKSAKPGKATSPKAPESGARLEPLTRAQLEKIKAGKQLVELKARLKTEKDPTERARIEYRIEDATKRYEQKPGDGFYNWDAPDWSEHVAFRVHGTPDATQIRDHVQKVMLLGGMSPALREELAAELRRQGELAPRSVLDLRRVEPLHAFDSSNHGQGTLAYYDTLSREITFNPRWDSHRPEMDAAKIQSEASGWWTRHDGSSAAGTMAHEFGHHVAQRIFDNANIRQRNELAKALDGALGARGTITSHVRKTGDLKAAIDAWLSYPRLTNPVSEYGRTSHHELLAEIWREYSGGRQPRAHIQTIGEAMRRVSEELDIVHV